MDPVGGNGGGGGNGAGGVGGGGGPTADTSGISEIAGQLAGLSRQIAQEQLKAEFELAPAKAEKGISSKGT